MPLQQEAEAVPIECARCKRPKTPLVRWSIPLCLCHPCAVKFFTINRKRKVNGDEAYTLIQFINSYPVVTVEDNVVGEDMEKDVTEEPIIALDQCEELTAGFLICSPQMKQLARRIRKVAPTDATVLIEGETGTGKELVARAIHEHSKRASGPYIIIDCTSLSETLVDAELFGYEPGSFTGAIGRKQGLFEIANGGSVFIDEISELPFVMQAKLLRVLENHTIRRVGATTYTPIDVRVIIATNRNLREMVEEKLFRSDLFYRIAALRLRVPPLRERPLDIIPLAQHFLSHSPMAGAGSRISPQIYQKMIAHDWLGNVRALKHAIERAVICASGNGFTVEDLGFELGTSVSEEDKPFSTDDGIPQTLAHIIQRVECAHIRQVLEYCKYNMLATARFLGVDPATLHRRMKKYRIERKTKASP
jgi:DNA-binding NtrC family response regulator